MAGVDATGTVLSRSDMGSVPTFVDIANVTSGPDGPGLSRTAIDTTAHDSPDNSKEYIPGMVDPGEVSLTLNWNSAAVSHQTVRDDIYDQSLRDYRITEPDGGKVDFSGFVTGFSWNRPVDDKLSADATFQVSGKPVWTDAT
jgi:predicted secreted protein